MCDTVKYNGVSDDAFRLRLFPFSLKDKAKHWLISEPPDSITSWDDLSNKFLARFFLLEKAAKLRIYINMKESRSMKRGRDSNICRENALTIVSPNGCKSIISTTVGVVPLGLLLVLLLELRLWGRTKWRLIKFLRT